MATIVSRNAYKAWEDNPILTTVSTTAHPIHKLEYPAITICGQGMATDTLDRVLKQRFDVWLRKRNVDMDCKFIKLTKCKCNCCSQRSPKISWKP